MKDCEAFIEDKLKGELLKVLASRWAALLPSLARVTQKLQVDDADGRTETLDEKFALARTVLDAEYAIYADGMKIALAGGDECPSHFSFLLRTILTNLSVKESVLADWRAHAVSIPPDTLRVYCHSILASPAELTLHAERCLLLLQPSI